MYALEAVAAKLTRFFVCDKFVAHGEAFSHAAVAAILRDGRFGAELFFIVRAQAQGDPWSGHVAFPGGRRELGDASLLTTAVRETREEVGVDLARAELLARLPGVTPLTGTRRRNLVVTPYVFALRENVEVITNYEVAETLWVPVETLLGGAGKGTYAFERGGQTHRVPCLRLDPGQHVLWGMTHGMVETLLHALR